MYKTHKIYAVPTEDHANATLWLCYGPTQAEWVYATSQEEAINKSNSCECNPYFLYIVDGEPKSGEIYINISSKFEIDKKLQRAGNAFDIGGLKVIATDNPAIHPEIASISQSWVNEYAKTQFKEIQVLYDVKERNNQLGIKYFLSIRDKNFVTLKSVPNKWYDTNQVVELLENAYIAGAQWAYNSEAIVGDDIPTKEYITKFLLNIKE